MPRGEKRWGVRGGEQKRACFSDQWKQRWHAIGCFPVFHFHHFYSLITPYNKLTSTSFVSFTRVFYLHKIWNLICYDKLGINFYIIYKNTHINKYFSGIRIKISSIQGAVNGKIKRNNYHIYPFLIKFHIQIPSFIVRKYLYLLLEEKVKSHYFCCLFNLLLFLEVYYFLKMYNYIFEKVNEKYTFST